MKKFEHGGNIYDGNSWLDFSANINPLGLSQSVKSAIENNIDGIVHYPDPAAQELKSAIANKYKVKTENIVILNGAAEFFYLFFNTIRPDKVMIPVPSFSEYERAAIAANCEIKYFFTHADDNFNIDFDKLIETIHRGQVNCIILANPNNPTGNLLNIADILKLTQTINFVIVDESFIDFIDYDISVRDFIDDIKNLITVQSLTKFFAIPGLRLGFAVADESLVKKFESGKDVWNVNYLAQKAGIVALADDDYIAKSRNWIEAEKKHIISRLNKINNVKFFEPTVNFVLIKFPTEKVATNVLDIMKGNNILLRNCANFVGLDGRYIRMAIRSNDENNKVLNVLEEICND